MVSMLWRRRSRMPSTVLRCCGSKWSAGSRGSARCSVIIRPAPWEGKNCRVWMRYTRSPATPTIIPAAKAASTTTTAVVRVLFTTEGHPVDGDLGRVGGDLIDRGVVGGALHPGETQHRRGGNGRHHGGEGAQPAGEQLRASRPRPYPRADAGREADDGHVVQVELQLAGVVAEALEERVVNHFAAS